MARNWYQEQEDDMDERNESFGRDFVSSFMKKEEPKEKPKKEILKQNIVAKIYTHKNGQLSFFEDIPSYEKIGTNRGVEYIKYSKRGEPVKERGYIEEYLPELED